MSLSLQSIATRWPGLSAIGVELGLVERRRELRGIGSGEGDLHVGALVFDAAHRPREPRMARALREKLQPVGPHRDLAAIGGDDVVAAHELRDESRARQVEHLARRTGLLDAAVVHDDDEVGECHRLVLAVGDVQEGDAELLLQALELGAHPDPQKRVERRERLVEQEYLRLGDERAGERDALLLPAGELVGSRSA